MKRLNVWFDRVARKSLRKRWALRLSRGGYQWLGSGGSGTESTAGAGLEGLMGDALAAGAERGRVDVLLDTYWMPVVDVDSGHRHMSERERRELCALKLDALYGTKGGGWVVSLLETGLTGRWVGFGLPMERLDSLLGVAKQRGWVVHSVGPALTRLYSDCDALGSATGLEWMVIEEDDRYIAARAQRHKLLTLDSAVPVRGDLLARLEQHQGGPVGRVMVMAKGAKRWSELRAQ